MKYHFEFEQRSAEWSRIRLGKVTASSADQIITRCGKPSKQSGAFMLKLLSEYVTGESSDNEFTSHWMQRGIDEEARSVQAFEFHTGLETIEVGFVEHDNNLWGCSPDRVIPNLACVQLKNPAPWTQLDYLLHGAFADEYFVQVQFEMFICEFDIEYLASHHPKLPPVVMQIKRDEEFIGKMRVELDNFTARMLGYREQLEREYGPFVRPEPLKAKAAAASDIFAGMEIAEEDLKFILERN